MLLISDSPLSIKKALKIELTELTTGIVCNTLYLLVILISKSRNLEIFRRYFMGLNHSGKLFNFWGIITPDFI